MFCGLRFSVLASLGMWFFALSPLFSQQALVSARRDDAYGIALDAAEKLHPIEGFGPGRGELLAWGEAPNLRSLLLLWELSGEKRFAEIFNARAEAILGLRDDRHAIRDELRGRVMPAWSTEAYGGRGRTAWTVHSAVIIAPMARFVRLSLERPSESAPWAAEVRGWLPVLEEAFMAYEPEWKKRRTGGAYQAPSGLPYYGPWRNLAFNMQCSMGLAALELYRAGAGDFYLRRAEDIARLLASRLRVDSHGVLVWPYFPYIPWPVEDYSHGALDAAFLVAAAEAGFGDGQGKPVFSAKDRKAFQGTISRVLGGTEGFPPERLNGRGRGSADLIPRWALFIVPNGSAETDSRPRFLEALSASLAAAELEPKKVLAISAALLYLQNINQ